VVQSPVCLFASVPATFVHALDFFVPTAGALVLLGAGDGNERVYLRNRMSL
jgi:hypothetical protein